MWATLGITGWILECFNYHWIWIWRRMEKISCLYKVTNEEVLSRVNEDRQILNSVWQRKHRWIDPVVGYDGLLHEIIEGGMKGKPTRGRRRIQIQHDLANVAPKRAAEDRKDGDTEKGCQDEPELRQMCLLSRCPHSLEQPTSISHLRSDHQPWNI